MKGDRDYTMIIPLDQQYSHGGLPAATPELRTWLQWEEGLSPLWNEPGPAGMRTGGEKALRLGLLGEGKKFCAKIKGIRVSSPSLEMSGGCQNSCSLSPWTLGLGP